MIEEDQQFYYPETIHEILDLMKLPSTTVLAGGTGLTLERKKSGVAFIDLQFAGLAYIKEEENRFLIGAMTTAFQIYQHIDLPEALRNAANEVGDTPLLHAVTIGGNLAKFYNWVDLPPMLWALNASIVVHNPEEMIFQSDEFFSYASQENIYSRKELITEIILPKPPKRHYASYQTLSPLKNNKSSLILATYIEWNDDSEITTARLVLSGSVSVPMRITAVETILSGLNLQSTSIDNIDWSVLDEIDQNHDFRYSVQYRKEILRVYLKRALKGCKEKMEGN